MKTIKSRLLLLITAAVMTLCLCIGLAACGEDAFPAPENVKVEGNTFSWDAVEEAEGYTVKINDDQTAATANNSLDLTTVTSKLKEGANTLAVKVNAKEGKGESAYSAEVTYNYTPAPVSTPFATPTGLKIENGILSWNAVSGATAYIVACGTQSKEVTAASINLALFELTEGETVTFTVKVKASGDKLESAAATSPEFVVPNPAAVIGEAKAAIAEVKSSLEGKDDEAVIAELNEFAVIYEEYPDYVKEDGEVTAAYAELTEALETAKNSIKTQVDALKEKVNELNGAIAAENVTEAYYNTLNGYKAEVEEFGAYAKTLWTADLTVKIDNEIKVLLATPDAAHTVKGQSAVISNHQNQNPDAYTYIYVMRTFKNVLGETIKSGAVIPEVTTSANATAVAPQSANADGVFVWKIYFTTPAGNDTITITYKVGDEAEVSVTAKILRGVDENDAFTSTIVYNPSVNGKVVFYGGAGNTFADVYLSSDVTRSAPSGEVDIIINGMPLALGIPVYSEMTEDALKTLLARADIRGQKTLTLIFYNKTEESGAVGYSSINSASIVNYTCNLTDDDVKARLPFVAENGALEVRNDGSFICGADFNYANLVAAFNTGSITESNVRDYLRYHVYVYKNGAEAGSFYAAIPGDATLDAATIRRNVYNLCGETAANDGITLRVAIALAEDSEYSHILRESVASTDREWNFTASAEDTQLPLASVLTNGRWSVGNGANIEYQWEATSTNRELHNGIDISVYVVGDKDAQTYDFVANDKPLAVYNDTSAGYIAYSSIEAEILAALGKLPASGKVENYTFVFVMQAVVNENGIKAGYMSSAPVYATTSTSAEDNTRDTKSVEMDWSVPNGNQLSFNAEGTVMVIAEQNQPAGRGSIYDDVYGVLYIEIKFTVDGNDYLAYAFKEDDNTLNLYANADKSGTARNCDRVDNGWVNVEDFIIWVNANNSEYAALTLTDLNGIEFSTKIVHDGSYYVGDGNYSSAITCPNS
ncbi:MAG: hypothetical protein K2N30_05405 [Clostridia bacterium]|nr:hypothetical protein [Clostridia bacterium]